MLMGPDSPMAETLRPARDTAFFFGGGGPKKRVMKRIDLDSDGDGERGEEGEEQRTAGFQVANSHMGRFSLGFSDFLHIY